jgi:hypothetical protein
MAGSCKEGTIRKGARSKYRRRGKEKSTCHRAAMLVAGAIVLWVHVLSDIGGQKVNRLHGRSRHNLGNRVGRLRKWSNGVRDHTREP